MRYAKPPLPLKEQVRLLASRGLVIDDPAQAESFLRRVNYYRFSAYCPPFEGARHVFIPGTRFEQVRRLYEFDRKLRILVLEAVEPIEVALRAATAHRLALRGGPFAHAEPVSLKSAFPHADWLKNLVEETERSKETFVAHFKARYEEYPLIPVWAAVELMSFGALSKLFGGLFNADKEAIAKPYGVHPRVLGSWLHTLVYVRNLCAHHARLWNRELAICPGLPRKDARWRTLGPAQAKRPAGVLFLLNELTRRLPQGECLTADWRFKVERLLREDFGVPRFHEAMGLPRDWTRHPLWIVSD
jgi:abortive infection bacteriophage resistance protein